MMDNIYMRIAKVQGALIDVRASIEHVVTKITPMPAWPGKNQAERDTAKKRALDESEELQGLLKKERDLQKELLTLEAQRNFDKECARSEHWKIRARFVDVVETYLKEQSPGKVTDYSAHDAMQDAVMDGTSNNMIMNGWDDEVPF